jgi:ribose 5-phosphate isomerase RpiB
MAANKVPVRARDVLRRHDRAECARAQQRNVSTLGGGLMDRARLAIVDAFLATEFGGDGTHARREDRRTGRAAPQR